MLLTSKQCCGNDTRGCSCARPAETLLTVCALIVRDGEAAPEPSALLCNPHLLCKKAELHKHTHARTHAHVCRGYRGHTQHSRISVIIKRHTKATNLHAVENILKHFYMIIFGVRSQARPGAACAI